MRSTEWLPASRLLLTPLRFVLAGVAPQAAIGDRGRSATRIAVHHHLYKTRNVRKYTIMRFLFLTFCVAIPIAGIAQPIDVRDDLIYPVNPPRPVNPRISGVVVSPAPSKNHFEIGLYPSAPKSIIDEHIQLKLSTNPSFATAVRFPQTTPQLPKTEVIVPRIDKDKGLYTKPDEVLRDLKEQK